MMAAQDIRAGQEITYDYRLSKCTGQSVRQAMCSHDLLPKTFETNSGKAWIGFCLLGMSMLMTACRLHQVVARVLILAD